MKVFTQRREVPVSVERRRADWRPFGAATKQEEGITYPSFEEIKIEKADVVQKSQLEVLQETTSSLVVCRRCGGAHWTLSCPYKDVQGQIGGRGPLDGAGAGAGGAGPSGAPGGGAGAGPGGAPGRPGAGAGPGGLGAGSGKYVPPSARAGGAGAGDQRDVPVEELTQLRVSNLSEDVEEDDLRALFRPFGNLDKIFLARDRETGIPRGFAFVRYLRHDEAEAAMKSLDGLPFMVSPKWNGKEGRRAMWEGYDVSPVSHPRPVSYYYYYSLPCPRST